MRPVPQLGDHADVATAAAQRPVQLRVVARVGGDPTTVGEDDLRAEQVVQGKAEPPAERAVPAGQGQAGHAHVADHTRGHHQVVRGGGGEQVGGAGTAGHRHRAAVRIDPDGVQAGQVEHQAPVAQCPARPVVPARADRHRQVAPGGDADRRSHLVGVQAVGDQGGLTVDGGVPQAGGGVEPGFARLVEAVTEQGTQPGGGGCDIGGGGGAHGVSSTGPGR